MSSAVNIVVEESTLEFNPRKGTFRYASYDTESDDAEKTNGLTSTTPSSIAGKTRVLPRQSFVVKANVYKQALIERIKQRWDGTVIELNDDELTVKLEDLTHPENPNEIVTLSVDEIDPREQGLIKVGAMFLWHIGYREGSKYPRERFSKIRFRRLPQWSEMEIQNAGVLAKEYANFFNNNTAD